MQLAQSIKAIIRDVQDFPKPGIVFKDITPILAEPAIRKEIVRSIANHFRGHGLDVTIDMRHNDIRTHQNPPELLLSAITACSAVDVVSILRKRKKSIRAFDLITTGKRRTEHPRAFTDIHCEYIIHSNDITEEEVLKAAQLAIEKYCTVAASLRSNITWSAKIVATER